MRLDRFTPPLPGGAPQGPRAGAGERAPARQEALKRPPQVSGAAGQYVTPRLQKVIEGAEREMERLKDEYVSTEHLLLAAADGAGDPAQRILREAGGTPDGLYAGVAVVRA